METGDPIWIESLMSDGEWKEYHKRFPKMCSAKKPQMFECDFKWRHLMGAPIPQDQIKLINDRILEEEQRKCFNYSNQRPLYYLDNLKRKKYE
jgi:hypothetical protein